MKLFITYFICSLLFVSCTNHKENNSPQVTDEEIYMIVNMVLKDLEVSEKLDGTKDEYIQDELTIPSFIADTVSFKLNKYFSKAEDLDFLLLQFEDRKSFALLQDSIKSKKIISKKIIDSFYDEKNDSISRKNQILNNYIKKYGNNFYYRLSLPIFSKDKNTVLIDVSYFLGGGKTMIYKKHNGKWTSDVIVIWT